MSEHDASRREFLRRAAVGAGAVAGAGVVPEALSQSHEQDKKSKPDTSVPSHTQANGEGLGAFLNRDDAATVAAFTERLMPGAPGKPGARDCGVLNYIDLALAGAYADLQDFYWRGLAALDGYCRKFHNQPFTQLSAARQDEVITALVEGKATGFIWPTAQAFFNTVRTHTTADFAPQDELRYFQRQDLRPNVKKQPVTWRRNPNERSTVLPTLSYGNQAGGGTVHYGSVSWRLHEDDFRARSQTIERYGASAIPEDSSLIDWPLSYADLEPYYDRIEYELGVSGKAGNLQGRKIDGGNVFEAPRRREFPLPPLVVDQAGAVFDAAAKKLSYHPFSTPRAILSKAYKGRPGCTYCGFCQAFGCHVGAKSSIPVTVLPQADATGNFKLITGAMCYRVNSDNSGRVTGVAYWGPDGPDNTIEAELVIPTPFIYDT